MDLIQTCKCVPGAWWCHHIHFVSLLEIVQTDHIIVERAQLDAAHKRSETQRRGKLGWKQHRLKTTQSHVKKNLVIKYIFICIQGIFLIYYRDIWWDTTNKEHYILGVNVKQWVCAWSFAFLDELLLVCGALTGDGQEDFSMSAQPSGRNHKEAKLTKVILALRDTWDDGLDFFYQGSLFFKLACIRPSGKTEQNIF